MAPTFDGRSHRNTQRRRAKLRRSPPGISGLYQADIPAFDHGSSIQEDRTVLDGQLAAGAGIDEHPHEFPAQASSGCFNSRLLRLKAESAVGLCFRRHPDVANRPA